MTTFARYAISVVLLSWFTAGSLALAQDSLPAETDIDRYVNRPDASYSWEIVSSNEANGMKTIVVDMVSQTWRSPQEVDRTQWQHWVTLTIPAQVRSNIGFLFIGGGRNGGDPPQGPSELIQQIAAATGTVVAELHMVPNQALIFHDDGQPRVEDDLIGYTWDQYLKTGEANWVARNPMVKSAVRAMDTMTAVAASETGGKQKVDRFVVAGGSKRGWTTWLTGAVDQRVVAIVPIVIDVLNVDVSMRHHFAVYGFWAPAIGNYVEHRIMERLDHPRIESLYRLVDPYYYRHRLTMPKFIVNAAGDQFFLPDSSRFYWDDLQGPKYLRYVPNADHGLDGSDALESITAFYSLILKGQQVPRFSWSFDEDGSIRVTADDQPKEVLLWQATNPQARDFRVETLGRSYTSTPLQEQDGSQYVARVSKPPQGWTAFFVELTYDVGLPKPLKLTTAVRVVPDTLPHKDKNPAQPPSLTVVCTTSNERQTETILAQAAELLKAREVANGRVTSGSAGTKCFLHWTPNGSIEAAAKLVTQWLGERGFDNFQYQLGAAPVIDD